MKIGVVFPQGEIGDDPNDRELIGQSRGVKLVETG
jgi:hypothetical protein